MISFFAKHVFEYFPTAGCTAKLTSVPDSRRLIIGGDGGMSSRSRLPGLQQKPEKSLEKVTFIASARRVDFEYYLDVIQALRQCAYGRKSERDPFKIVEYKRWLRVLPGVDEFSKNKIDWYDADRKVARWEEKLSSPAIDSGRPVRVEDRQLSPRQYAEEGLHSAINYRAFLEFKIFNYEHKFPRWREALDEILKKLAADLNPTPGNGLIDRDVLLALGQMALKASPGESGGVVIPPATLQHRMKNPRKSLARAVR